MALARNARFSFLSSRASVTLIPSSSAARCTASRVRISAAHRIARGRRARANARAEPRTLLDASPASEEDAREAIDAGEGALDARSISSSLRRGVAVSRASRRARGASSDVIVYAIYFSNKVRVRVERRP